MNGRFKGLNFKLISLVFLGITPLLLGIFFYVFPVFENYLLEQRKAEVKTSVDILMGMLENIQSDVDAGKIAKKDVPAVVQKLFSKLRYNKTDYFFAYDERGYNVAHGRKPEMVGTSRIDTHDSDNRYYVKDFIKYIGKDEGGLVPYKFEKVKDGPPIEKISYIQAFKPLNWVVGSGVYLDVVQEKVNEIRLKVLIGFGVLTLLTLSMSWFYANKISAKINAISADLFKEADKVAEVAINIGKASESLSSCTTQQASALQETSASIEETSAMISRNAENAKASMAISSKSQVSVEQGKKILNEMIYSIQEIAESNAEMVKQIDESNKEIADIVKIINEIGDKTKVINDIVFQTKLLSFNASVEAARAGEQGKGFAVVAEEVGNLAQMSGNSSKEISDLLGTSITTVKDTIDKSKNRVSKLVLSGEDKVKHSAEIAKRCGEIFDEIVVNVNKVNEMVSEIASASDEQATGVREITSAVAELDSTGQQNTQMSQKTADYAEQLQAQVVALRKNTTALNIVIQGEEDKKEAA